MTQYQGLRAALLAGLSPTSRLAFYFLAFATLVYPVIRILPTGPLDWLAALWL